MTAALALAVFADTPTVSNVKVQQRYPWNNLVDIDYELSGDTEGLGIAIEIQDRQNNKTYTPTKFAGVLPTSVGKHRVTWSPAADGVNIVSTNIVAVVSLLRIPASPADLDLYCVIDLSGGRGADRYPVTTLSAVPNGGVWPDEYKTTKLVLRRIDEGTFSMGGSTSVTITQPFYIGVFEVTQKQYELVMESNPSSCTGDMRPVECLSYNMIRGTSAGTGWPSSSGVDGDTFLYKLRVKTGIDSLDLPTEAQWEYACRAGTTSRYNNGGNTEDDLKLLGRYLGNRSDGRGGYSEHTTVGSYAPNAWGLYDMHGNVWEWCLDWYQSSLRVGRGGGCGNGASDCVSSGRGGHNPSYYDSTCGFRLSCSAGLQ